MGLLGLFWSFVSVTLTAFEFRRKLGSRDFGAFGSAFQGAPSKCHVLVVLLALFT
jgi:hypothetical protein